MALYEYTKDSAFPEQLAAEIEANETITTALDYVYFTEPDDLDIVFIGTLSGAEETALNTIVSNHTPVPTIVPQGYVLQSDGQGFYYWDALSTLSGTEPTEDWQFATKSYTDTTSGTLQLNIDDKADITYVDNSITTVSGNLQSDIDDKADITYVDNSVNTVSGGLQTQIDGKADTVHTHTESDITDLDKYTQAEVDTISGSLSDEIDADISAHETSYDHTKLHDRSHAITSTADHTAGNWKVLYTDGSGNVQELSLGADGESLVSNGPTTAPYFTTISGVGGGESGPMAAVQARRTTSYTLTDSYVDITLDATDVESDVDVLEHNDTNTDRIDIKEAGTYLIMYGGTARTTSSNNTCRFEAQVRVNDSSAINGSYSTSATFEDSSIDGAFEDVQDYLSHSFLANLSADDFVTLQFRYASSSDAANILANTTTFKVIKLEGARGTDGQDGQDGQDGAQGIPGSGSTVNVYDDGTPVTGTPFETLNFLDATISGSPTVSGGVDITVYGSAGGVAGTMPCLQARRTTSYVFTTSFVDITLDTTDIENAPTVIEHNNTNTDRIDIKEDGYYKITYTMSIEPDATAIFTARMRTNDTAVIPGSEMYIEDSNDIDEMSNDFIANLSADDYITLQLKSTIADTGNVNSNIIITVIKLQGAKGDQGDPGSGSTIQVYDDGTPVTGTPFSVLNFDGATISGSPTISGGVDITVSAGEHDHDDRYYTESELDGGQLDNRYYTETEVDTALAGKADTGHTHTESDITDLDKYTQAEVDTISGTLSVEIDSDISTHAADASAHHARYTDEEAQDAVGGIMSGAGSVTVTYDDVGNTITVSGSEGGGSSTFGSEFHENSSESESSTTSESYQQKLRLTTSSLPSGTYYIQWHYEFWLDGRAGWGRVQIDDSETVAEASHDSSLGDQTDGYTPVSGFIIKSSFSGVKNIDIDYRTSNDSYACYIRRARLTLWRIS